jgi:molecular chaperone GrpE
VEIADLLSGDERVTELTADLQRMAAEYANYRKRVERERVATAEIAAASVLAALLPVLDDVARAREHGELEGAFKTVGDSLGAVVARLGLETYAEVGDVFDPELHEALTHTEGAGREQAICAEIYQPGYKYKGRVVRPARVSVSE